MRCLGLTALVFAISLGGAAAQNLQTGPTPEQIQMLVQAGPKAAQLKPGEIDSDLVGTWQGIRSVPTAAFAEGTFTVRIFDKGQFISIFRGANAFQVETGRVLAAGGAIRWQVVPGRDDMMAYRLNGDSADFVASFGSPFSLKRIAGDDPTFAAAEALVREPATPTVSDWARRGQEWADLWQADAQLYAVSVDGLTPEGYLITGKSNLTLTYFSAKANASLTVTPGLLGTVMTGVVPGRAFDQHLAGPIPLPLLDLSDIVKAANAAHLRSQYDNADLGVYDGERRNGLRLVWNMTPTDFANGQRVCFDVAANGFIDCRTLFGDPVADYNALAARAAAAWAALLHRGHGGPVPIWSLSGETMSGGEGGGGDQRDYQGEWALSTAESNAYWAGDYEAYDNLQENGCSGGSEYGC
jgi:hypothetical protein